MTRLPGLTAITLNPDGGGVAAVARLVRRVLYDEWGPGCAVYELGASARSAPFVAREAARLQFGARVAADEATGRSAWLFHSHLAVARVQQYIPRRLRAPYGVFLHGIEAWSPLARADRRLLEDAAVIVTNSLHTATRATEANPGLPSIAVCALGHSDAGVTARVKPSTDATVLTVARMASTERYKGHDQLIEALPELRRSVPRARLVFVGTGDDLERLRRKAQDLGVGEHVVFTGFVSDEALREAYVNAAVFAMPSRGEGFGLAYLEAMSAGLPCVGSVHDAAQEIVEDGATGFLVDQANISQLADRLRVLLTDPRRRVEMGRRGRERWERAFTYDRFRQRFLHILRSAFPVRSSAEIATSSAAG